jgi:hypothetical protein
MSTKTYVVPSLERYRAAIFWANGLEFTSGNCGEPRLTNISGILYYSYRQYGDLITGLMPTSPKSVGL